MQIFVTSHALQRMQERGGADPDSIHRRIASAQAALASLGRRARVALVGQDPPLVLDYRPPSNVTVVTVLPRQAGTRTKRLVRLPY